MGLCLVLIIKGENEEVQAEAREATGSLFWSRAIWAVVMNAGQVIDMDSSADLDAVHARSQDFSLLSDSLIRIVQYYLCFQNDPLTTCLKIIVVLIQEIMIKPDFNVRAALEIVRPPDQKPGDSNMLHIGEVVFKHFVNVSEPGRSAGSFFFGFGHGASTSCKKLDTVVPINKHRLWWEKGLITERA